MSKKLVTMRFAACGRVIAAMKTRRPIRLLIALAAAGSPVAHAAEEVTIPIVWNMGGRFEQELEMPADAVVEACEKLPAGAQVRWRFDASAPMDVNVHYHQGKKVEVPVRMKGAARGEDTFVAKSAQGFCWMWTNKASAPVWLQMQLQRR